ncbi:MAG: response regulator transcription factor [Spirochaetes bacterium]|nr:response regulator transcription factor [Spirochaetota bacterium]
MKICIVEDSEIVQGILRNELGVMHDVHVCGIAQDPVEAMEMIRRSSPDLVILDIVLKGGNGFEVLSQIREEEIGTSVLVLTNYPFPQYREICGGMGAHYFFDKSIDMERALKAVRDMAAGKNCFPNRKGLSRAEGCPDV